MSEPLIVGLDLGTTNAKAAAYDLSGHTAAGASISYPTHYPRPGWAEQRPADWIDALSGALQAMAGQLGAQVRDIAGIGLSCHAPCVLFLDADGNLLTESTPTWQDERCLDESRALLDQLGAAWPGVGTARNNFPPKLLWAIRHHPEAARARYAISTKDFLAHWLTGQLVIDPSSGPGQADWYEPVFAACGWSVDRLAPIAPPITVIGTLRAELANIFGLPQAPVILGLNDAASATLATGASAPGDAVVMISTNGVVRLITEGPLPPDVRLAHALFNWPYISETWIAGGQTKSGASTLNWLTSLLAGTYGQLLAAAHASPPGANGVLFLPYLMGRGSPHSDSAATGTFSGLTLASTRGDLVRAALEGTAFALKEIYEDLTALGCGPVRLRVCGGGARSALWRQILADVLGQSLTYFAADSTLGAAILAGVGVGLYVGVEVAVGAMARPHAKVEPDAGEVGTYEAVYLAYRDLRDTLYPVN